MTELPNERTLNALYDALNARWWADQLPKIPVRWSPKMHALAVEYRWSQSGCEIALSLPYHQHYPKEVEDTLIHEMIHVWQDFVLKKRTRPHGGEFKEEAMRVRAPLQACAYPKARRPYRYELQCANCGQRVHRRIWVDWACGRCCTRYNNGKYDSRFTLRLLSTIDQSDSMGGGT